MRDFEDMFTGLGYLPGKDRKEIQTWDQFSILPSVSQYHSKHKEKIDEMEKQGIIIQEIKLTDWISSLVAVQKPRKLKVCIDPWD